VVFEERAPEVAGQLLLEDLVVLVVAHLDEP
jgi:hypothetical protein